MDPISLNPTRQEGNKKTTIAIIIFLIAVAVVGGFFMLRQPEKKNQTEVLSVSEKKVPTPTPTEKPVIDKETVRIQVSNGTGTPGQAGSAVKALEEAGYNADNIETSNADEYEDTITTITAREGFEDVAKDIKGALKATFDDVEIDSSHLDKDSDFDISIVTGGKKYEEATPSATVAPTEADESPTPNPSVTITATVTPTPTSTTPTPIP